MTFAAKEYDSSYSAERHHRYSGKIARYMDLAKRMAYQSTFPDYRHGAVLVKGSVRNVSSNKDKYCSFATRAQTRRYKKSSLYYKQ